MVQAFRAFPLIDVDFLWRYSATHTRMATAFGDELCRKFLSSYDTGAYSLEKLAAIFTVSVGWAKKISAARTRTGRVERPSYQPGRKPLGGHPNPAIEGQFKTGHRE